MKHNKLFFGLALLPFIAYAKNQIWFDDYRVEVFNGTPATLVINNALAKEYRTTFKETLALNNQKNLFAGEYLITSWGCGMLCSTQAFVNLKTGKVLEKTFGGECNQYIEFFLPDSRLLITKGISYADNEYKYFLFYYVLENETFKEVLREPINNPQDPRINEGSCG